MTKKKIFTVPLKRKKQGRTDYNNRLHSLMSKHPRLVVRKSNKNMQVQLIKYGEKGDIIIKTFHTKHLNKYGWDINCGNIPAAYLVGYLAGLSLKGEEAILDIGLQAPIRGSRIFAVVKGAHDGGLKIKFSEEILPKAERLSGKHIAEFSKLVNKQKLFSGYLKNKKDPEKIQEYFEKVKTKMMKND